MTNEERAREAAKKVVDFPLLEAVESIILTALNAATAELEEERGRLREAFVAIEALRPLSDAATQGEWVRDGVAAPFTRRQRSAFDDFGAGIVSGDTPIVIGGAQDEQGGAVGILTNEDAALIVAAVNTIRSAFAKKDTSK